MEPGIVDIEAAARLQARESEEWKVIAQQTKLPLVVIGSTIHRFIISV